VVTFTGTVRCAYAVKRSRRRSAGVIIVLILVGLAFGLASKDDEASSQALASDFSQSRRCSIVASWNRIPLGE